MVTMHKNNNMIKKINTSKNIIRQSKNAQFILENNYSNKEVFNLCNKIFKDITSPIYNMAISKQIVKDTGFGKVTDKINKNFRKTQGLLNDIKNETTFGLNKKKSNNYHKEFIRPMGIIGSLTPSVNPIATLLNNIINALITRNSIIISVSK